MNVRFVVGVEAIPSPNGQVGVLRFTGQDGGKMNLAAPLDLLPDIAAAALAALPQPEDGLLAYQAFALRVKAVQPGQGPAGEIGLMFELEQGARVTCEIDLGQAEVLVDYLAMVLGRSSAPPSPERIN